MLIKALIVASWVVGGVALAAHGHHAPQHAQPTFGGPLAVVYADGDTVSLRHTGTAEDRFADATGVCDSYGVRYRSQYTTIAGTAVTLQVVCDRPVR